MQDATKTTLSTLLNAESTQVNPLIANSTDETIDFGEAPQAITPPRIGTYWPGQGGIYAGIVRDGERQWHLLLSPAVIDAAWGKYPNEIPGEFTRRDGLHNTKLILATEPENAIAKMTQEINIEGHSDYYWPAAFENNLICINLPEHVGTDWHWSSTQCSANLAWFQHFEDGGQYFDTKLCRYAARAVRRILIIE